MDNIDLFTYYEIGSNMIDLIKSFNKLYSSEIKNKINNDDELKKSFNEVFEDLQLLRIDYNKFVNIID